MKGPRSSVRRTEETKKQSKHSSPGTQDQSQSSRYAEDRRHSTSSERSSDTDHSKRQSEVARLLPSARRSPRSSRAETRSKDQEPLVGRARGSVDESGREPSVQILNPEDNRDRESRAADQASNRGRPLADAAQDWLQTWQQISAEGQQQINRFLMNEAHHGCSEQERRSHERQMERFQDVEKEFQRFITKGT